MLGLLLGSLLSSQNGPMLGTQLGPSIESPKSTIFLLARIWASLDPCQMGTHTSSPSLASVNKLNIVLSSTITNGSVQTSNIARTTNVQARGANMQQDHSTPLVMNAARTKDSSNRAQHPIAISVQSSQSVVNNSDTVASHSAVTRESK